MTAPASDPGFDLTGLRALVTGASAGIGAAIAARLAAAGATVAAVSRSGRLPAGPDRPVDGDGDGVHRGGGITAITADLADPEAVETVVDRAVAALGGGLDVLVNNAGRGDWKPFGQVDRAYFEEMLWLNLWVPLRLCQLAHPHLRASDGGVVVMIGSVDAVRPSAGAVVYGATKAGLGAATVALAKEWGADGIRVVQVDPGIVDTPMTAGVVPALEAEGFGVNVARRAGRPDEVAGLVHYLVSPLGGFATGVSYRLDGGAVAMGPFDARRPAADPAPGGGAP